MTTTSTPVSAPVHLDSADRHIIEFVTRYHKIQPSLLIYKTISLKIKVAELVAVLAPHNTRDCYQLLEHIVTNPLDHINLRDNDHLNHTQINWVSSSTWKSISAKLTELEDLVKAVVDLSRSWV